VLVTTAHGHAYVYGIEIESAVKLEALYEPIGPEWSVRGGFDWNYGRDTTNKQPLRHTQPARGLLALRWDDTDVERGLWWELSAEFVRRYDRAPNDQIQKDRGYRSNPQDPNSPLLRRDGSIPGYSIFDLRGGINLNRYATLILAVENLTDKKYRRVHSRWNEIGINFQATLELKF
jgi:outer membrane receptor protein involved in Fe transport